MSDRIVGYLDASVLLFCHLCFLPLVFFVDLQSAKTNGRRPVIL